MLETFRKHNYVLMCIIAVIVVVAFTFLYSPSRELGGVGQRAATLFGRDHTVGEVGAIGNLGSIAYGIIEGVEAPEGQDPRMHQYMLAYTDPVMKYVQGIGSVVNKLNPGRNEPDYDFPINVIIMRREAEKLGIEVDRSDLEAYVKTIPGFMSKGRFDIDKYEKFLGKTALGDRKTVESKLFTLLRDMMLYQKLGKLIGAEFAESPAQVNHQYAKQHQKTTVETALVDKKAHENQTISDEDVQKYYDGEKAKPTEADPKTIKPTELGNEPEKPVVTDTALLSEEIRSVKYVLFEKPKDPDPPTPPAPVNQDELNKLPEDQKKIREEENKKLADAHTAAMAEFSKKAEESRKAAADFVKGVADLSNALAAEDRGEKSFEEMAKAAGYEVKSASFARATPPEDLKSESQIINIVYSSSLKDGEHTEKTARGWCIIALTGIEKRALLPLEQVKEKIREQLKKEKIDASLKAAADSARSNLLEGIKAGKSFKDAATAAMLIHGGPHTFSSSKPLPKEVANADVIPTASQNLGAGEISEAIKVPDGQLLVFLVKKELPKDPKMEEDKKNLAKRQGAMGDDPAANPLFRAWFASRRQLAEVSE